MRVVEIVSCLNHSGVNRSLVVTALVRVGIDCALEKMRDSSESGRDCVVFEP